MDRGAWQVIVHGVVDSWTCLSKSTHTMYLESDLTTHFGKRERRKQHSKPMSEKNLHIYFLKNKSSMKVKYIDERFKFVFKN